MADLVAAFLKGAANPRSAKCRAQTATPAFKNWFKDSKVVEPNGCPKVVYHGTTADFTEFKRSKANIESDMGAGFYFTSSKQDVDKNYAGIGPDLTQKIQLLAEQIASERDVSYDDPEVVAEARAQYMDHAGVTMPVFLALQNPLVLGGKKETQFTFEQLVDQNGEFTGDEKGTLVDFILALRRIASHYGEGEVDHAIGSLAEAAMDGTVGAKEVLSILKDDEQFGYFMDYDDDGKRAGNEIVRQALEEVGFDGIIDTTPHEKFGPRVIKSVYSGGFKVKGMKGLGPKTIHYIAFEPTQVKSAVGNRGTFDPKDPSILKGVGGRFACRSSKCSRR